VHARAAEAWSAWKAWATRETRSGWESGPAKGPGADPASAAVLSVVTVPAAVLAVVGGLPPARAAAPVAFVVVTHELLPSY
jgi:hypothetical protein